MSTLLTKDNLETKQVIIEDGIFHARLSTKKVTTQKGNKMIITHEIVEPVNSRDTGEPVSHTVRLDRWIDLAEKDGEEVVAPDSEFGIQLLAKAIGHTAEDGDFTTDHLDGKLVKVKVGYSPSGVSKSGKEYSASNQIKAVMPKDETFEEVAY